MTRVGLLYPGFGAEDDYPQLVQALRDRPDARLDDGSALELPLVHTSVGEDAHRVDALLDLGSADRLAEGARELMAGQGLDALMWACTSGSFVFGWEGAHDQVARLQELTGLPVSSTSLAFVSACRHLGLERVAVVASYPDDVATHFRSFLGRGGVEVTALDSHGIVTAREVGELDRDQFRALVLGADLGGGAQGVLVPDTAMHSLAWVDEVEQAMRLPVLTANQVTVFEGLRIAGRAPALPELGQLLDPVEVTR